MQVIGGSMFKVGDKVKLISKRNDTCNHVGDVGIITEVGNKSEYRVTVKGRNNHGNWTLRSDLELVSESKPPANISVTHSESFTVVLSDTTHTLSRAEAQELLEELTDALGEQLSKVAEPDSSDELKIGDRVEVIEDECYFLKAGEVGTVVNLYESNTRIQSENPTYGDGLWDTNTTNLRKLPRSK